MGRLDNLTLKEEIETRFHSKSFLREFSYYYQTFLRDSRTSTVHKLLFISDLKPFSGFHFTVLLVPKGF